MEGWIWLLFAAMGVGGALSVMFSRNIVHCGYGLLFALLSVSAMYVFLGADFLAATQVIVYVGGILVLVVFAVMMTHRIQAEDLHEEVIQPVAAGLAALFVLALSGTVIVDHAWPVLKHLGEPLPSTRPIGRGFLTRFLMPFEFASVLLLVAMIGAAMFSRERRDDGGDD